MKIHHNLEVVRRLMPGLAQMLGPSCEIVLHDLTRMDASIVAMEGNVTGRRLGDGATNYLVSMVQKYGDDAPNCINYKNILPDNRVLRSTTLYIHDDSDKVVGALCINQDVTDALAARRLLEQATRFADEEESPAGEAPAEVFSSNVTEMMETIVNTEVALSQHAVAYMQKDEKLRLVRSLDARGVFDVRGAVEYVAKRLGVTNYTVYNYLKEVKGGKADQDE